jgi:multisubunit Na+/H+ antiporter MnhF subunit
MGGLDQPIQLPSAAHMRTFEIIIALICALVLFFALKIIGLVIKFALIAAVLGFVAGLVLARMLRRS